MLTKQDLLNEAFADIDKYPALAVGYRAGDPTILQPLGAVAAMLAATIQQMETAAMERFSKERDSTILADAAIRGIIPRAKPARIQTSVTNKGATAVALEMGRVLLDPSGNPYMVETPVTIAPNGAALVTLAQSEVATIVHSVSESLPFYAVEIPAADDGAYLASIAVKTSAGEFAWRNQYTNVDAGEMAYHVEVDDKRRTYVRFGLDGVVGVQPRAGERVTLTVGYSFGDIVPAAGSKFSLEYPKPSETGVEVVFERLVQRGEDPISMDALRELAKYPSVYADDAVFLGEFEALVRKNFQSLQFLSVWNEASEELVRGASIDNTNRLFVAVVGADGDEVYVPLPAPENEEFGLSEAAAEDGEAPEPEPVPEGLRRLAEDELTEVQREIRRKIWAADDGYRVTFCTPVQEAIGMIITCRASSSYNRMDVEAQIRKLVLDSYGKASAAARRGYNRPLHREVYKMLRDNVPALNGGDADWQLTIEHPAGNAKPELWRFVSEESLVVSVEMVNTVRPSWGA